MIRFSTRKAAPFVMMDKVVEAIFTELNLEFHVPGIWLHERLSELVQEMETLQASIRSEEKKRGQEQEALEALEMQEPSSTPSRSAPVSLASRLVPLIAMLKLAKEKGDPVIWELA